nr:unnamed protein product [Callosobruchus analis]
MVPYPGIHDKGSSKRIYNYRLSRARRMIENVFGIMTSVFRIFRTPILLNPEKANVIVQTCVLLHNFLRRSKTSRNSYTPTGTFDVEVEGNFVAGSWRNDNDGITSFKPLKRIARKPKNDAEKAKYRGRMNTSEIAKTKWRGLRDTFRKELSKNPKKRSGDEGGIIKESKWAYFKSMEFLKDQFQKRHLQDFFLRGWFLDLCLFSIELYTTLLLG